MRKNIRILSAGLVLCMLISLFSQVAYAEGGSAFVSGQYETVSGENIEIELKATDSTGVIAMLCEIEFDAEFLEILRYDDAKLIGGTLTAKTDESPMRLFWMDALAEENTLVNGTLGTFTFRTLKPGKTEINVNYIEAYTKDGDLVPFENAVTHVNIKESDTPIVEAKEYTIKATAGANGKINPSGEIKATEGKQLLFIFTPDFGYKVNEVKTPNLNSRTKFNFIKVGGNDDLVHGDIPASSLEEINNICRKGVTIFHDYNSLGDYTVSNTIVTPST